jgi:RNA polymerase sporulation-specific sigma factor
LGRTAKPFRKVSILNEILMYFRTMKKTSLEISMNEPIDTDKNGNTLTLIDVISCDDTILEDIDTKMKIERLSVIINKVLDQRERTVIMNRYGLNGIMPLTQRETAKKLCISRSYVSRIEKKALETLKKNLNMSQKISF